MDEIGEPENRGLICKIPGYITAGLGFVGMLTTSSKDPLFYASVASTALGSLLIATGHLQTIAEDVYLSRVARERQLEILEEQQTDEELKDY